MRKSAPFILLVAALGVGVALAQSNVFAVSKSHPIGVGCGDAGLQTNSGASLSEAQGYSVIISADRDDAGVQSLFATGTANCCFYGATAATGTAVSTQRWVDCPAALDLDMTTCASGSRDCVSGDFETPAGYGRVAYVPTSVVVDGGLTTTTTIVVRRRK